MTNPVPVIRPVQASDFEQILALAEQAGGGMTNLPADADALQSRIDRACASFEAGATGPGPEIYLMALTRGDEILGTAAVFSSIGLDNGFVNYKVVWTFHASEQLNKRIRRRLLMPTHDFTGSAEVGSLFLSPGARGGGFGKFLARSRYLFIAQTPVIIADPVCAELRGWRMENGRQPFWEALGAKFFEMDFEAADVHNAATGNQFIADLMPRHPIYVCLLPEEARACIGRPHDSAEPAYQMLTAEGFEFDNYIDIFDGGPLLAARQADIKTIRDSRAAPARIAEPGDAPAQLIAAGAVATFRCVHAPAAFDGETARIAPATAAALEIDDGQMVRIAP